MPEPANAIQPFDVTLLARPIEATGQPDLDGGDQRLDAIGTLVMKSNYVDAAREAGGLFEAGIYDLRTVGAYLLGSFVQGGMPALPTVIDSLTRTLTTNWGAFGPAKKKQVFADNSIRWMFKGLQKLLEYHAKRRDAVFESWITPESLAAIRETIKASSELADAIDATLPAKNGAGELYGVLLSWLSDHVRGNEPPPTPAPTPAPEPEPEPAPEPASEGSIEMDEDEEPAGQGAASRPVHDEDVGGDDYSNPDSNNSGHGDGGINVPSSQPLLLLLRKLDAFQHLLNSGEFAKASIIAQDVIHVVDNFDPRVYLPALFSPFYAGLAMHADRLEQHLRQNQTLGARALDQLYRVDFDSFMNDWSAEPGEPVEGE